MREHEEIKGAVTEENISDSALKNDPGELRRKRKRKAQLARLVGLVAVCAVLAVGYAVAVPHLSEEEAETPDTSVPILNLTEEDVLSVSYTSSGGETVSLSYDSTASKWLNASDAGYPVTQMPISAMATAVAQITAEREIVTPDEFSVYGLDEPSLTISVSYADGNDRVFKIGDYNEYIGYYYMCIDGAASVYTVSEDMVTAFDYTLDDLIELETLPSGSDITFTSYTVTMPSGESHTYEDEALIGLLSELAFTGWEKYDPTEEDKASFALGADTAVTITVNYEQKKTVAVEDGSSSASTVAVEGSYLLTVGGYYTDENGEASTSERWLMYDDSKIVYKADASLLDTLIAGVAPVDEETSAETAETVAVTE